MSLFRSLGFIWLVSCVLAGCSTHQALLQEGRIDHHLVTTGPGGTNLDAWIISARDADGNHISGPCPTAILLHPWLTSKAWFLPLGEQLARTGWNVILPDLRAHGASGGLTTTWGALERKDIKAIVDLSVRSGWTSDEVYAFGASLGGCVAILYAADDPRCRGVVAVAPVDGIRGFFEQTSPLLTPENRETQIRQHSEKYNYDPADAAPSQTAATLQIPLRLIWGKLDTTVPPSQTNRIFDAWAGPKEQQARLGDHGSIQWNHEDDFVAQLHAVRAMASSQSPKTP